MCACTCIRDWGPMVLGANSRVTDVVKAFCCLRQASFSSSVEMGTEAPEAAVLLREASCEDLPSCEAEGRRI